MTDNPNTITLGGQEFPIAKLSLGQMRTAVPAMLRIGITTPEEMAAQITVILAAVSSANPAIKLSDIETIRGVEVFEITEAVTKIGVMMGFTKKAPQKGEAEAGQSLSTGPQSTD